ncbi:WD40 repeat domain-containing protein [Ktedonosporobacter rubrisoli]|uniref:WD40 repeat domain-containing protein n=1 Tax=Ktedonosporobacter rubrisoli TaxID=2509675 RepID=A0A4P6JLP2_KTERU|nr:WD40 repeat domain-containing protein [Ktedonosporobacter rubrisoli]QBD76149.1 WD40 repeat domain-containing protein [Ktedonosporobacter rubrisoli]
MTSPSQRSGAYPPPSQPKQCRSILRGVALGPITAVAFLAILSFVLSACQSPLQTAANASSIAADAVGQAQSSQAISSAKQICTFTTAIENRQFHSRIGTTNMLLGPELSWSTQGQLAASGSKTLQFASATNCQMAASAQAQTMHSVSWSPDGSKLAMLGNQALDVVDHQGHTLLHRTFAQLQATIVDDVFWTSDNNKIIFTSDNTSIPNKFNSSIKSINVPDGSNLTMLWALPTNNLPFVLSADNQTVGVYSIDPATKKPSFAIWNLNTKKQVSKLSSFSGGPALSPDGSLLALDQTNQIEFYSTADGKPVGSVNADKRTANTILAWSPDGKYIARNTGAITIYDVQAKKEVAKFGQVDAQHAITTLAWSPDSKGLVSASGPSNSTSPQATVQVWALN